MKLDISVITDSLGMPRIEDGVEIVKRNTWPILLQDALPDAHVFDFTRRARTMDSILQADYNEAVVFSQPNVIILQIGVVDSMPRIFSKREKSLLSKRFVPNFLRNQIIENRKKKRASITSKGPLAKVYTSPETFESSLSTFIYQVDDEKLDCQIIILPILINESFISDKSPGASGNIQMYNDILMNISENMSCKFIDIYDEFKSDKSLFASDGYHLSVSGNNILAKKVKQVILQYCQTAGFS